MAGVLMPGISKIKNITINMRPSKPNCKLSKHRRMALKTRKMAKLTLDPS